MCFHFHPSDEGEIHIPMVFLHKLPNPTNRTVFWHTGGSAFILGIWDLSIPLFLLKVKYLRMTCSSTHLFPISAGPLPKIVSSMFLSKRKWKVSTYGGEWLQRRFSGLCFVCFQSTILRPRWPIKFGFRGQKINTFWLLPAGLTKEKKSKQFSGFWSEHTPLEIHFKLFINKDRNRCKNLLLWDTICNWKSGFNYFRLVKVYWERRFVHVCEKNL